MPWNIYLAQMQMVQFLFKQAIHRNINLKPKKL